LVLRVRACRHLYPGGIVGICRSWLGLFQPVARSPTTAAFPKCLVGRLPRTSFRGLYGVHITLRPARSPHRLAACCLEGFDGFVTSTAAPIATGWSDLCRVGITPTEEPRLCTAHGHPSFGRPCTQAIRYASDGCLNKKGSHPLSWQSSGRTVTAGHATGFRNADFQPPRGPLCWAPTFTLFMQHCALNSALQRPKRPEPDHFALCTLHFAFCTRFSPPATTALRARPFCTLDLAPESAPHETHCGRQVVGFD
jgi:hypothetical protein